MKHLLISLLLVFTLTIISGCGSKSPANDNQTQSTSTSDTTKATETLTSAELSTTEEQATEEPQTNNSDEPTEAVATKEDTKNFKPITTSGTFQGFADNNSVEILMSDGQTEVFLVDSDSVIASLEKCDENATIQFTYTLKEGQVNKLITNIK